MSNTAHHRGRRRGAFTLVELLIVITIIGILMALLLPAVNAARRRAQQATCTQNQSQLAKALIGLATTGKGNFPGYLQWEKLDPAVSAYDEDEDPSNLPAQKYVSWAAKMLPQIDQQGLWDQMRTDPTGQAFTNTPRIDVFLCPSDAKTNEQYAGLTYVINSGAYDNPNPSGNAPSDYKQNGIAHNLVPGFFGPKVGYGTDIKDGATMTMLLSENIHKDEQDAAGRNRTWIGPTGAQATVAEVARGSGNWEQWLGMVWVWDSANPLNPTSSSTPNPFVRFNQDEGVTEYSSRGSAFARPSSAHSEVFIAAFADGSVRAIRDNIEFRVYQQLLTTNGAKAIDPSSGDGPLVDFMRPPLSDSDF